MSEQTPNQIEAELILLKKSISDKEGAEEVIKNNAKDKAKKDKEEAALKQAKDVIYQGLNKAIQSGVFNLKESSVIIDAFEKLI